ncbi:MAG: hypothetical protein V3U40_03685 [Candidatus Scalindua sediminis]
MANLKIHELWIYQKNTCPTRPRLPARPVRPSHPGGQSHSGGYQNRQANGRQESIYGMSG